MTIQGLGGVIDLTLDSIYRNWMEATWKTLGRVPFGVHKGKVRCQCNSCSKPAKYDLLGEENRNGGFAPFLACEECASKMADWLVHCRSNKSSRFNSRKL